MAQITRMSLFVQPGHNSIDISRQDCSRQTTGKTVDAMIDAMNAEDAAALIAFCQNVLTYTAGRPITCTNVPQPAPAAGILARRFGR